MNKEPEVIVFCAAYNHEPYIRSALDGFVIQKTSFKVEVIVHDDASTDNTAEIIREYEAKYPDLFSAIYETENQYSQGRSFRRELTQTLPYGKYVAICEGDDYWTDPLKLQKQYDFMECHPDYTMCLHESIVLDMLRNQTYNKTKGLKTGDFGLREVALSDLGSHGSPQTSSFFMRKEVSLAPEWMAISKIGDYQTVLNCAINGRIFFMEDIMSTYRFNSGSISWTATTLFNSRASIDVHKSTVRILELLDEKTDYIHSDELFPAIVRRKYEAAYLEGRPQLIYYDKYKGTTRKYDWKLTFRFSYDFFFRLAKKMLPKPIDRLLRKQIHKGWKLGLLPSRKGLNH